MSVRNKEYLELLRHSFDEKKFIEFIIDLLNLDISSLNKNVSEITLIPNQYKDSINYYKFIANYNDGMNNVGVFIIKLNDTTSTKARNMQRNFVATLLKNYSLDGALVSFFSDKEKSWRFSFVKKELSFTDNGVKEQLTSAKRYSYLVGEGESVHTAQEFLLKLLDIDNRKITIDDIEKQFDVEKVTKKFFEEYKEKYLKLKEFLDKNEDFQTEAENCDFDSVEFAKKLMGQIVFLYFLQKKGWLGVQLIPNELSKEEFDELLKENDSVSQSLIRNYYVFDNNKYVVEKTKLRITEIPEDVINLSNVFKNTKFDMPWGSGDKEFIRHIFTQSKIEHKNFFDDYLEHFFYKGLNEKRENQFFPLFNCKIPFLNGGLFEPLNNYRWSSAHFEIPNSLFSNDDKNGILDFLDLYNFTIDEEEPLEKDVAVDPEMLGKIFENLLDVDDRKSKGAFYTPREIVYFMCQESLANYLVNKIGVDYNEILNFIKYGDVISQYDWELSIKNETNFKIGSTIYNKILDIDNALINIKIADPAVGSGAFPLGMLTEIVKLRNNIQTYIMIQSELGILDLNDYYGSAHLETDIYNMKLQTIENCIYAVDIETSAVDIAKLRLWLSLIVDYPNDKEPKPLPNLDCKIMQGNSLIDEFEGVPLFSRKMMENNLKNYHRNESNLKYVTDIHIQQTLFKESNSLDEYIEKMLDLQKEYFITSDNKLKKELKNKIDRIQLGMVEESLVGDYAKLEKFRNEAKKRQKPWFIWELEFYDVFKNNNGFDIVIGNPPYVSVKGITNSDKNIYRKRYVTGQGRFNLFTLMIEKGINILNDSGLLTFIQPDGLFTNIEYRHSREFMLKNGSIKKIVGFDNRVFESAAVDTAILEYSNIHDKNNEIVIARNLTEFVNNYSQTNCTDDNNYLIPIKLKTNDSKILNEILNNKYVTLESLIEIQQGIIYSGTPKEEIFANVPLNEHYKKSLDGRDVHRWFIDWETKAENKYIEYTSKLHRPREERLFIANEKLIIPRKSTKITVGYDNKQFYVLNTGYVCLAKNDDVNLKYLMAILNSNLINYYYSKQILGWQIVIPVLNKLPIVIDNNKTNDIVTIVDKLIDRSEDSKELEDKLNKIIYEIYGLSSESIQIIESFSSV